MALAKEMAKVQTVAAQGQSNNQSVKKVRALKALFFRENKRAFDFFGEIRPWWGCPNSPHQILRIFATGLSGLSLVVTSFFFNHRTHQPSCKVSGNLK
jgi:hypothetical protein